MTYQSSPARSSLLLKLLMACAVLFLFQACSEPLSAVNDFWRSHGDSEADAPILTETQLVVSQDGHVSASGVVQEVSSASLMLADATFLVTEQTSLTDVNSRSMALSDVSVGLFLELEGKVRDDGAFEVVSGRADATVVICHVPGGNPDNAHSISVGARATAAHMRHGDYEGECEGEPGDQVGGEGQEDETDDPESDDPDGEKVLVCHIPPGNPENAHTINIGVSGLQDHLDHGDYEGACLE